MYGSEKNRAGKRMARTIDMNDLSVNCSQKLVITGFKILKMAPNVVMIQSKTKVVEKMALIKSQTIHKLNTIELDLNRIQNRFSPKIECPKTLQLTLIVIQINGNLIPTVFEMLES